MSSKADSECDDIPLHSVNPPLKADSECNDIPPFAVCVCVVYAAHQMITTTTTYLLLFIWIASLVLYCVRDVNGCMRIHKAGSP